MIEVRERPFFEHGIDTKRRVIVRSRCQTITGGLCENLTIDDIQQRLRVNRGDHTFGGERPAVSGSQRPHPAVFQMDGCHLGIRQHFSPQLPDFRHQSIRQLFRRSFKTGMNIDIQIVDQSEDIGGGISRIPASQRAQIG